MDKFLRNNRNELIKREQTGLNNAELEVDRMHEKIYAIEKLSSSSNHIDHFDANKSIKSLRNEVNKPNKPQL